MAKKKIVRLGMIGLGNISGCHLGNLPNITGVELSAVCDIDGPRAKEIGEKYDIPYFTDHKALLKAKVCDAIIICTPHYDHTTIGIDGLKAGYHVMVEKPISVHKADCEKLIAAHKGRKKQVFAAMFNQRTDPHYTKIKHMIETGELGKLQRVNWIITDWFRTQHYYNSGGWRATWSGEGGGVLLNQCPHNLDLLQWLTGMPSTIMAHCKLGSQHNIEVEDKVTAYLEYPNGATGVFITTTGEAPGTNRLEVVGDRGKVVAEGGKLTFTRNEVSSDKFLKTAKSGFAKPPVWNCDIPVNGNGGQHKEVLQNFVNAILNGEKLIAPAPEGINSVELANAMLYSSATGKPVSLPLNSKQYQTHLNKLIKGSKFKKKTVKTKVAGDMGASFGK